jgi:Tfp pilus assembly PilM family ATPase
MARFLAIEWDEYEVRAVEADIGNGRSAVHRVLRAALPRHEGSPTVADVSAALRSAFGADAKVPKEAVLVVPREALLVKALTLPLAPPEELPTMVRYQMVRELNLSLEGAALDFVPLPGSAAMDQQQVLAAALPADALARHHDVARQLGVHPTAMPPRPLAVAELLRAEHSGKSDRVASPPSDDAVLVIDFSTTSAELTVLVSGQVAFTRSHRFSEPVLDAAFPAAVVARETRRTLAALPSHFPNHPVGRVVILGDPAGQAALAQAVSEQAELPVEVVDPFQRASVAGNVDLPAGARGRFGALMGAVLGQASGRKPAMDFLNPRQPPVRRSRRKL